MFDRLLRRREGVSIVSSVLVERGLSCLVVSLARRCVI